MSERPRRIQLRRSRVWRKPPGAVVVARPSRWGNPFRIGEFSREEAIARHREWLLAQPALVEEVRTQLEGRDLACWCPLEDDEGRRVPCHADTLLELANP